jgi:hypothetical protein
LKVAESHQTVLPCLILAWAQRQAAQIGVTITFMEACFQNGETMWDQKRPSSKDIQAAITAVEIHANASEVQQGYW